MSRLLSIIILLLTLQPITILAAPSPATLETKRLLVLYSLDKGHPAHGLTEKGISEGLQANRQFNVQLFTEYLDMGRFPDPGQAGAMAAFLRRKYQGFKLDGIITFYPSAVDFLQNEGRDLFPDVPIVAGEVSRSYAAKLEKSLVRRRITGTIMGENITGVLDAALRMMPATKRVALVAGVSPLDLYNNQIIRDGLKRYSGTFEQIDLTQLSMTETLTRVSGLPSDTIIFYTSIIKDAAGRSFAPRDALSHVSRAANVPVFSLYDTYLGYGIVGGRLVSFELQGKIAATLALRVMAGESPAAIPFGGDDAYVERYDWRELKRWHIRLDAIPAAAEIRFRQMTFWEEHHWVIIGALSLAIIETVLIFGLGINLKRRKKAEAELKASESSLRSLSGKLLTAQEEERRRIARELHDDVTQRLAVLSIEMGKLELQPTAVPAELKSKLGAIKNSLVKITEDIHAISRKLHPAILDDLGLVRAVQSECAAFTLREGIIVTFRHEAIPEQLPKEIALVLYRIIQESLRNIARHSQAESALILINCTDTILQLSIADAGVGFDPQQAQYRAGLGLVSMAERVKLARGSISVDSVPGEGTVINVQVPLEVNSP